MTTIVTRASKGSALTWTQADANFTNLNTAKYESGDSPTFNAITATSFSLGGISIYPYNANNNKLFGLSGTPVQWQADIGGIVSYGFKVSDNYFLVGRGSVSWVSHGMRVSSAGNYVYTGTSVTPVWMELSGGQVQFMGAASGTAGNTITPNYPLQVDAGSNIVNLQCGQLAFPATQSASSGANTLDDYEEGTWTPADASGAGLSFTTTVGSYTKIGRLVYVRGRCTYPATANGSEGRIGGLPFTANSTSAINPGISVGYSDLAANTWLAQINGTTYMNVFDTSGVARTNAQLSGKTFYFGGCYEASA